MKHNSAAYDLVVLVESTNESDVYDLFGIDIQPDGSVIDVVENTKFSSLLQWAISQPSEEVAPTFVKRRHSHEPNDY